MSKRYRVFMVECNCVKSKFTTLVTSLANNKHVTSANLENLYFLIFEPFEHNRLAFLANLALDQNGLLLSSIILAQTAVEAP